MSRFSQGFRTTNTATVYPAVIEFLAGASDRARLVELGIMLTAQTLSPVGLAYPAAKGVTPTSPVTLLSENPGDSSTCGITSALAWATPPTAPTGGYYFRRGTLGLVSDELVWTWPKGEGILILPSTSIVLFLLAVGAALDGWAVFEQ